MVQIGERYRHYKSTGGNDHTYEIVGLAKHSETEDMLVIYKPLFDAEYTWLGDCHYAARPLSMWDEEVEWEGEKVRRFVRL